MRLLEDRLELEALFSFRESARATTTRPSGERCGQSALERRVCGTLPSAPIAREGLNGCVSVWMCFFSLYSFCLLFLKGWKRHLRKTLNLTYTDLTFTVFFFFVNMNFGWRDFMQTQYVVILPVFSQINMNFDFFTVVGILLCSEISIHYTSF